MSNLDDSKDPSDLTDAPDPYEPPRSLSNPAEPRRAPDHVTYIRPLSRQKAAIFLTGIEGVVVILGLFTTSRSGFRPEIGSVDILRFLVSAAAFIVFLTWFFRMYKNLYLLGREHMRCTPGWAVGYWFIPFLNLIRPIQCVYDIWRAGALEGEPPVGYALFGWWWAAWIGSSVLAQVAATGERSIIIASHGLDLLLTGLTMLVIHTLGLRQERKARSAGLPGSTPPRPTASASA